jgi:hypothetical protein
MGNRKSVLLVVVTVLMIYEPPWQPFLTVTFDCPGKDSLRIWPLLVVDPWNEDWFEWVEGLENLRRLSKKSVSKYVSLISR